ncbi:MAG: hypothetical protein KBT20_01670 [Bacteroidales bacterium]|nr:hypothetical protein [Candidatus Liminaster caballi]
MKRESTLSSNIKWAFCRINWAAYRASMMICLILLICPAVMRAQDGTLPEGQRYRHPLFNGLSVSFNAFPPALTLFGKGYASFEGMATVDLHHRFFPQFSAGVGYCDHESANEVRYQTDPAPFFKAGMAYNFKYNDENGDDFYGAFLRVGYAHSESEVSNLYYTDGYWEPQGPISIDDMKSNSCWLELGGFIKVKVASHLSLGWDASFRPFLHKGSTPSGHPYFVPGYGPTTTSFGFAFHIYYDLKD